MMTHTTNWFARCRTCGTTQTVDVVLPIEIATGSACPHCGSVELTVTETGSGATITFFPPITPPVKGWQCCHCGGAGLDSYSEVCQHCDGHGHC